MKPLKLSATALAKQIHVSPPTVNDIVREKRVITPEVAVRLGRFFSTSEQFWLNLQNAYDVSRLKEQLADTLKAIKPRIDNAVA